MKEHPILFNSAMVRAVLDGRKTQTRRVIKPQADHRGYRWVAGRLENWHGRRVHGPIYEVGDRLWVRESMRWNAESVNYYYTADSMGVGNAIFDRLATLQTSRPTGLKSVPSIHMPRWASRILLEITDVRRQMVQEISEEDAIAEGIDGEGSQWATHCEDDAAYKSTPRKAFMYLWDSINGKKPGLSWVYNPWVQSVSFRRITP